MVDREDEGESVAEELPLRGQLRTHRQDSCRSLARGSGEVDREPRRLPTPLRVAKRPKSSRRSSATNASPHLPLLPAPVGYGRLPVKQDSQVAVGQAQVMRPWREAILSPTLPELRGMEALD